MQKEISPKRYFWLPYALSITAIVMLGLGMAEVLQRDLMGFVLAIVFAAAAVSVAVAGFRKRFSWLTIPETHSPQHYLLLLWHSVQSGAVAFCLHGAVYALFWHLACRLIYGHVCAGDEPVFFIILLFVIPAGFIAGAVGRLWQWAVVQPVEKMEAQGIKLPASAGYFTPIGSYIWLWSFAKGVEAVTARRMRAAGVFAAVFFLGGLGFVIVRVALQSRLSQAVA
ncbi:MAG: hypothetical protein JW790_02360 [Dehalococcoidales bacterium]|nr:hypothetical protein [Dehalococcoidales bacterium]